MAQMQFTAETTDEARIKSVHLSTERRTDPDDGITEQMRAVLTVVIEQDAYNISGVENFTETVSRRDSLTGTMNGSDDVTLEPAVASGFSQFNLLDQQYDEMEAKGSLFFRGTSVWQAMGEWETLVFNDS